MRALRTGSTITVYVSDIMSSTLLDVDPLNPPEDAWPLTYPSEESIKAAFPQHNFEFIGDPQQDSIKVSPPISDEELKKFLKEKQITQQVEQYAQNYETNYSEKCGKDELKDTFNIFDKLIINYKFLIIDYKHTKNKLESKLKKAYLEGYAHAIILQYPYAVEDIVHLFDDADKTLDRFKL